MGRVLAPTANGGAQAPIFFSPCYSGRFLFAEWEYKPRLPAHAQAAELPWVAHHWLLAGNLKADQVAERVVIDWLLRDLPWAHRQAVGIRNPSTALEYGFDGIELAELTFQWEAGVSERRRFPRGWFSERPVRGNPATNKLAGVPSHHDEPIATGGAAPNPKTGLRGCAVAPFGPCSIPECGQPVPVSYYQPRQGIKSFHAHYLCTERHDKNPFDEERSVLRLEPGRWTLAFCKIFRFPVLLGRDWPRFDAAPLPAKREPQEAGDEQENSSAPRASGFRQRERWERTFSLSPTLSALRREEQPALCRTAKGGGEVTTGGSMKQDGGYPGISSLSPTGRTFGGRQHRPADSRPVPLAWRGRRGKTVLSILSPIIGGAFKRIGMDHVGPLPKSARGHKHILVIVDYATRYPEAIPLRKATSKAIAQELFLLASQVSIPAEILTDQGTPFMSRLMADLFRLVRVPRPQLASPFELLFGPQPHGLLDVAREVWEQQPAAHRTMIEQVREMRKKINQVMPLVREHMVKAQQAQQRHLEPLPV
ncbi:hypothetical protein QQF64_000310 [Cirrhinus molitorella]|uniref:Integrase catalytic domain-containing protein n=1 Tax=Cirrhinus molitorella TaxID=172907 RepID=A0ABR3NWT7_9TELE